MKKFLFGSLIAGVVLIVSFYLPQGLKAQQQVNICRPSTSEPIVFEMNYRGLSGKDELRYNSYYSYGLRGGETQFIKELKRNIKELQIVYNQDLKKAELSAVELKAGKAVAFYFDLNADGKVSGNEKILPASKKEMKLLETQLNGQTKTIMAEEADFVTPDFIMNTSDNRQVPFRVLLQVAFGRGIRNCMWSPSCVLEGTSTIDGHPATLILYPDGFSGSFTKYGQCSYYLLTGQEKLGQDIYRQTLSSLINHKGQFYHLSFEGSQEEGKTVRVILEKYNGPVGELAVRMVGEANLMSKLNSARLSGSKDKTIYFSISAGQSRLPVQEYKLNYASMSYGTQNDNNWRVEFREGPKFQIDANSMCIVEIGKPTISIKAINEKKRYEPNSKEQLAFSKGTKIYISPQVRGKASELYGQFSKRDPTKPGGYTEEQPVIRIVDSDGKEVTSAKMKYG